jgi:DNA-binding GntR family transcriptional regulator
VADTRATAIIAPLGAKAKQTYKAIVHGELYELIQNLELPPGERLVEADLAARLGVSKTPVREALLMLEREGLVTMVPHSGATVTWLTLEDYEQHLFILDALELPALRLVVERMTPDCMEACAGLMATIEAAYGHKRRSVFMKTVMELHSTLFAAVHYPKLTEMIEGQQQALRRYTAAFVHQFEDNWQTEFEIVNGRFEGIRAGDPAVAAAVAQQGHARLLEFARIKAGANNPTVIRYLPPAGKISRVRL